MHRIPDVGNPWLDAGIVPYSTMGYNRDRHYWEKWFPADFITESFPGQFRNWFYAILAMSTMMELRPPTKVILGHGQVRDQKGEEMHKSKGNAIPFDGATDTGYKLFHARDPKQKLEAQAHRDLPEGWQEGRVREETILLENRPTLVVSAMYPPMGADEIRWLYCRHNPANNINFGPGPAEELRSKFLLKLWNTYAFFCNYARIDGFNPHAPQLPVQDRPHIDRWILSDLQGLIGTAEQAFDGYNVQAFCLATERFVDDKLSNWYVRRNRRRFWKSEHGADKLAAYQTLYTVLTTLVKLIAPIMPFLSESIYRNLRPDVGGSMEWPESVHLCDFPRPQAALIDGGLSWFMELVLQLRELGSAARNSARIKVRQPLAEMRIQKMNPMRSLVLERFLESFGDQIAEELNIKKITAVPDEPSILTPEVRANSRTLGPRLGPQLKQLEALLKRLAIENLDFLTAIKSGQYWEVPIDGEIVTIQPSDVILTWKSPEGWVGAAGDDFRVIVDARITDELAHEGRAREVVRHMQELRKTAGLEMEVRIVLSLQTDAPALKKAIETHKDYICRETLAVRLVMEPLGEGAHRAEVKVEGQAMTIELLRA
jgi:isoleucyl-tRNA synthetase